MNTPKKVRGDSILGTLPKDRQEAIAEYAQQHTIAETRAWLAQDNIAVSAGAVSTWLAGYSWRRLFRLVETDALNFMDLCRQKRPDLSEQEIESFGNDYFQLQAVRLNDPKLFLKFRTARNRAALEKLKLDQGERALKQREDALQLEREKFEWNASEACLKQLPALREIASDSSLSGNAKIQAIRQRLFGSNAQLEEPTPTA